MICEPHYWQLLLLLIWHFVFFYWICALVFKLFSPNNCIGNIVIFVGIWHHNILIIILKMSRLLFLLKLDIFIFIYKKYWNLLCPCFSYFYCVVIGVLFWLEEFKFKKVLFIIICWFVSLIVIYIVCNLPQYLLNWSHTI